MTKIVEEIPMSNSLLRALSAAALALSIDAAAQSQPTLETPITAHAALSPREALDRRLEAALDLDAEQRTHLQQLRFDLQRRLRNIRAQTEAEQLSEDEARWQVKMALAEHRQGRAALLTDEQTKRLEIAYNELSQRGTAPNQLHLSEIQEEQVRILLWSQRQEWRTLQEAAVPPTAEQNQALRIAHRVAFEHLLNSRQFEHLEQIKNARRRHYGLPEEMPVDTPMLLDDAPGTGQ
jgi:hypothetical protein